MSLVRVKRHFQITLPDSLRKKFKLAEGDYIEVITNEDGLVLKPVKMIYPDQQYFFTKEWQAGEAEADTDITNKDIVGSFDNIDTALKALKETKI